jgi:hypothetical protein
VDIRLLPANTMGEHNNTVFDEFNGKYFAILNSDDYWAADKLEKQLAFLENHPEIGAVFTDVQPVDENGRPAEATPLPFSTVNRTRAEWLAFFFDHPNCLCTPSVMIRRKALQANGGFRLSLSQLPDFDFWIRLLKHTGIYILPEKLTYFRLTTANASKPNERNLRKFKNELYLILLRYFDNMPDELFTEAFGNQFRGAGSREPLYLACEQAFLYLKMDGPNANIYRVIGMTRLHALMEAPEARQALAEGFNFTRKDFWRLMGDYDIDTGHIGEESHGLYQASHKAGVWLWKVVNRMFPLGTRRRKLLVGLAKRR